MGTRALIFCGKFGSLTNIFLTAPSREPRGFGCSFASRAFILSSLLENKKNVLNARPPFWISLHPVVFAWLKTCPKCQTAILSKIFLGGSPCGSGYLSCSQASILSSCLRIQNMSKCQAAILNKLFLGGSGYLSALQAFIVFAWESKMCLKARPPFWIKSFQVGHHVDLAIYFPYKTLSRSHYWESKHVLTD
jgi:hypothetical protein